MSVWRNWSFSELFSFQQPQVVTPAFSEHPANEIREGCHFAGIAFLPAVRYSRGKAHAARSHSGGSFFPSDSLSFSLIDESQTVSRLTLLRQVNLEKVKFNRRPTNSAKIKKCGVNGQSPCFQYGPALSLLVMKTVNCTKNCPLCQFCINSSPVNAGKPRPRGLMSRLDRRPQAPLASRDSR